MISIMSLFPIGCDQKHEQELDSEAIYKNFVLRVRSLYSFFSSTCFHSLSPPYGYGHDMNELILDFQVMAARSPNVRLRKALNRREAR